MAKKVVGIVGSYRKGRVIDTAVSEILRGAEAHGAEICKIYLIDKHIEFCANCRKCAQEKGVGIRAVCEHDDDMKEILDQVDSADALVLGSPVNFFNVTAVTRRFLERLLVYTYWPWGAKIPKFRIKNANKKAVIVTSSAAPAFFGRILMRGPLTALKAAAKCMGAKVVQSLYFGLVAQNPESTLGQKSLRKAYKAGERLVF